MPEFQYQVCKKCGEIQTQYKSLFYYFTSDDMDFVICEKCEKNIKEKFIT